MTGTMINVDSIYEHLGADIENIKDIDDRLINFITGIQNAPEDIKVATTEFLNIIDGYKKSFITCIVKRTAIEKQYVEALTSFEISQYNWKFSHEDGKYLVGARPDFIKADQEMEKSKMSLTVAQIRLDTAGRELAVSKEKLCLESRKAEHNFCRVLGNNLDPFWFDCYQTKSGIKRHKKKLKWMGTPILDAEEIKTSGHMCHTGADLDILIGGAKTNKLSLINLVPIPCINH